MHVNLGGCNLKKTGQTWMDGMNGRKFATLMIANMRLLGIAKGITCAGTGRPFSGGGCPIFEFFETACFCAFPNQPPRPFDYTGSASGHR